MPDPRIRPALPGDVDEIVSMVYELAEYEKAPEQCHLTAEKLRAALFGDRPAAFAHVATAALHDTATGTVSPTGTVKDTAAAPGPALAGFALHFLTYSTWEGAHGIYLEDLYVRPDHRGSGMGKALLTNLAEIAAANGYARVEWSVLDWNTPSIEFYRSLGAAPMDGWSVFRLSGPALARTATGSA